MRYSAITVVFWSVLISVSTAVRGETFPWDGLSLAPDLSRPVAEKLRDFGVQIDAKGAHGKVVFKQQDGGKISVDFTTGALLVTTPQGDPSYTGHITVNFSNPRQIDWTGQVNGAPASGFVVTDNEPDSILVQAVLADGAYRMRWRLSPGEAGEVICDDITSLRTVRSVAGQLHQVGLDLSGSGKKDHLRVRLDDGSFIEYTVSTGDFTFFDPQGNPIHTGRLHVDSSHPSRIVYTGNINGNSLEGFLMPMKDEGSLLVQASMGTEVFRSVVILKGIDKNGDSLMKLVATTKGTSKTQTGKPSTESQR